MRPRPLTTYVRAIMYRHGDAVTATGNADSNVTSLTQAVNTQSGTIPSFESEVRSKTATVATKRSLANTAAANTRTADATAGTDCRSFSNTTFTSTLNALSLTSHKKNVVALKTGMTKDERAAAVKKLQSAYSGATIRNYNATCNTCINSQQSSIHAHTSAQAASAALATAEADLATAEANLLREQNTLSSLQATLAEAQQTKSTCLEAENALSIQIIERQSQYAAPPAPALPAPAHWW